MELLDWMQANEVGPIDLPDGSNAVVIAGDRKYSADVKVTPPNQRSPLGTALEVLDDEIVYGETVR